MTGLLITACPYCGSSDVHELQRTEGHMLESVWIACLSCDEECLIDRNVDEPFQRETETAEETEIRHNGP